MLAHVALSGVARQTKLAFLLTGQELRPEREGLNVCDGYASVADNLPQSQDFDVVRLFFDFVLKCTHILSIARMFEKSNKNTAAEGSRRVGIELPASVADSVGVQFDGPVILKDFKQ